MYVSQGEPTSETGMMQLLGGGGTSYTCRQVGGGGFKDREGKRTEQFPQ